MWTEGSIPEVTGRGETVRVCQSEFWEVRREGESCVPFSTNACQS